MLKSTYSSRYVVVSHCSCHFPMLSIFSCHPFSYLYLLWWSIQLVCQFFIGLFSSLSFKSSYFLDTSFFVFVFKSDIWFTKIFSQSVTCLFILLSFKQLKFLALGWEFQDNVEQKWGSSVFHHYIVLAIRCLEDALYQVEEALFCLLRVFIRDGCWILSDRFPASFEMLIWIFLFVRWYAKLHFFFSLLMLINSLD